MTEFQTRLHIIDVGLSEGVIDASEAWRRLEQAYALAEWPLGKGEEPAVGLGGSEDWSA